MSMVHFWYSQSTKDISGHFHTYSFFALVRIRDQLVTMLQVASSLDCVHTAAFTSGPKCVKQEDTQQFS